MLIVDDSEDMRSLVRLLFDLEAAIEVVGEAPSCAAGVAIWRERRPDVVVLDYRMEDASGLVAAREILEEDPSATIVLFSAFLSDHAVVEAQRLGVRGCVLKDQLHALTDFVIANGRPRVAPVR